MSKPVSKCDLCEVPVFDACEAIPFRMTSEGPADAVLGDPRTRYLCVDCAAYFVVVGRGLGSPNWLRRAIDGLFPRGEAATPAPPPSPGGSIAEQIGAIAGAYSEAVDAERVEITVATTIGEARAFARRAGRVVA